MTVSDDRRVDLRAAALTGVVRSLDGVEVDRSRVQAVGAAAVGVVRDGAVDLYTEVPDAAGVPAAVAGAVLWADRQGAASLRLVVDGPDAAGAARFASRFCLATTVLQRDGATAVPVAPAAAPAIDDATTGSVDPATDELRSLLLDAGLEVVTEHGVVTGELLGLEVARLVASLRAPDVHDHDDRDPAAAGVHLAVGVGRFDQEATAAVRGAEPPAVSLRRTIDAVAPQRRPGRTGHPAATLARERWLRRWISDEPAVAGLDLVDLCPVPTTAPRSSARDAAPAAAVGRDLRGEPVVMVCSVGADLAFVPVAADTRATVAPTARLLLVVPERDLLPSTQRLADLVVGGAELVGVRAPWDRTDEDDR